MEDFIKERNEALLSLDKEKILAYGKKYNVKFPENEKIFWAGVHKAICNLYLISVNKITKACDHLSFPCFWRQISSKHFDQFFDQG